MGMSTAFLDKSKEIANSFLQSIIFLDDRAFEGENTMVGHHKFDAYEISKAFAKEKKICAVYRPTKVSDIEDFKEISKKADVVILDWQIDIQDDIADTDPNAEADAEADEPRGQYTKQIIDVLANDSEDRNLKLIIVYTGEDIPEEITNDIYATVSTRSSYFEYNVDNCEVSADNIRILVRVKSNDDTTNPRFPHRPHLEDKILRYEDLPSFILTEFTSMTAGLLSNFALLAFATIRDNTHKVLSLFSKDIDAAYMGHKVTIPNQNDSEELLPRLFGDTIADLLLYDSIPQKMQENLIDSWVDYAIEEEEIPVDDKKTLNRTRARLKALISSSQSIEERFAALLENVDMGKDKKKSFTRKSTDLFLSCRQLKDREHINSRFAKLTHHKSLFLPNNVAPLLMLGTLVRSTDDNKFYICIQQRCDSVRLKSGEERKFVFLPLEEVADGKFEIITPDDKKLRLNKNSYSIKTMRFRCPHDKYEIRGIKAADNKYFFETIYKEKYEWVVDLKDMHSQRIVTEYTDKLSRVGLDESEWLRVAGE